MKTQVLPNEFYSRLILKPFNEFKKLCLLIQLFLLLLISISNVKGQSCDPGGCANFTNQWPAGIFSTTSSSWSTVSSTMNAGNWTLFSVTAGSTYEWSYCNLFGGSENWDTELTLYNYSNGNLLCYQNDYGASNCPFAAYLRWSASFTGTVRLLTTYLSCNSNTGAPYSKLVWRQSTQGQSCTGWTASPPSAQFLASGGDASFAVNASTGGCNFTAVSNNSWINTITYSGNIVGYHVDINSGNSRNGSISIKDVNQITQTTFSISQNSGSTGCNNSVTPNSASANPATINAGNSTTLSFSGGTLGTNASWVWYSDNCGGSQVGSGSTISVSPLSTTTYYVRGEGGCSPNTSCVNTTVVVTSGCTNSVAPSSASASPATINVGNQSTLTVVGGILGTGASWQWHSGSCSGPIVGTGSSNSVSPSSTTTYFVNAVGGCGPNTSCVSTTVTLTSGCVNSIAPNSISANPASINVGSSSTLSINGGQLGTNATWKWYSNSCGGSSIGSGSSIVVSPTTTTTYYLRAEGGCSSATVCVNIEVNVIPVSTTSSEITVSTFLSNNSTISYTTTLWSGTTNQSPSIIKICADGSRVTKLKFINNSGVSSSNIRFWIASDPYGTNSDLSGYFVNYSVNGNIITAELAHPKFLPPGSNYLICRSDNIRIVDFTNPNSSIFSIPIAIYRAPVIMVHGLWGGPTSFADMKNALDNTGYFDNNLTRIVNYESSNSNSFISNFNVVPDAITDVLLLARVFHYSTGKVDIVCHSMGGILARQYIQSNSYQLKQDVHKLITINTPHSGSQAANLLLNITSCAGPSTLNSVANYLLSTTTNSSVNGGAISDLRVNSNAIHNLNVTNLNNGIVPSHAIITDYTPTTIQILGSNYLSALSTGILGCNYLSLGNFFSDLFYGDTNDMIVSMKSQKGGLPNQALTYFPSIKHIDAEKSSYVIQNVIALLNNNSSNSNLFAQNGFNPADLVYETHFKPSQDSTKLLDGSIKITYPAHGLSFAPGTIIPISLISSNDVNRVITQAYDKSNFFYNDSNIVSGNINYQVPLNAFGKVSIIAMAYNNMGFIDFDTVSINIDINAKLNSITAYPDTVYIQQFHKSNLFLSAQFNNGYSYDISNVSGLNYDIADTAFVRYIGNSTFYGKEIGATDVIASYLNNLKLVHFIVLPRDTTLPLESFELKDTSQFYANGGDIFNIYPNPNSGQFIISFRSDLNEQVNIVIYNQLGQVVMSKSRKSVNGTLHSVITLPNYAPSGIYYIKLVTSKKIYTKKILLSR